MFYGIEVRVIYPTDTRGTRLRARWTDRKRGERIVRGRNYALNLDDDMRRVAQELLDRWPIGLTLSPYAAATDDGAVFPVVTG